MLIKLEILEAISNGTVTLAFRRWKRPTVRAGGSLRTRIGVLSIASVERIATSKIKAADARNAGFPTKAALLESMAGREGDVYRIELSLQGEDPRIALREKKTLTESEFSEIRDKLAGMDQRSKHGTWTREVLEAIESEPGKRAADLAADLGFQKPWLKPNIRKLKELGLTISLSPGYQLSPRGKVFLKRMRAQQ